MEREDFAEASTLDASSLPLVDVSASLGADDPSAVADALVEAATDVGFFYLVGHGIDPALTARAFAAARDFFALPETAKRTVAVGTDQRGWMAGGMSRLEGASTHDLKEVFFWGRETAADDPDVLAGLPLVAPNRWPSDVFPRLEADVRPYHDAVCRVARHVLSALAVGLGAPADFFASRYRKPLARGQLVHYPPSTAADEGERRFGVAPHTDFGALTLLSQDHRGGLQVRTRSGDWIEAPPVPDTLVCNIGDLLQRWSNDRLVSTPHRVINRSGEARHSIPVFFDPSSNARVDPRDLGVAAVDVRHEPVTAGRVHPGAQPAELRAVRREPVGAGLTVRFVSVARVVAVVAERATGAGGVAVVAHPLTELEPELVEVQELGGVGGQHLEEDVVRLRGSDLGSEDADALRRAVNVGVDRQHRAAQAEQLDERRRLRPDAGGAPGGRRRSRRRSAREGARGSPRRGAR